MEININTNIQAESKIANKSPSKFSSSFSKTLAISRELISEKDPLSKLSKKGLKAIEYLEKILKIQITNDNFKNDGYLDIMTILRQNSENIGPTDEKKIRDTLLSAVQSDVISLKDYYAAIQWLDMRAKQRQLNGKSDEEILEIIDNSEKISKNIKYTNKLHDAMFSTY